MPEEALMYQECRGYGNSHRDFHGDFHGGYVMGRGEYDESQRVCLYYNNCHTSRSVTVLYVTYCIRRQYRPT